VVVTAGSADAAEALVWRAEAAIVSYRCGWLNGNTLDAAHLLRALGVDDAEPRALPATMRALLADAGAIGRPLVVVVRGADTAAPAALEELRLMLEGAADALDTVRLVLLGGPALLETLRQPAVRALASRVTSVVSAPEDAASTPLDLTSGLMNEPQRRMAARSPWPRPWRIAAAGLLGCTLAGAVVPLVMPVGTALPPSIAPAPAAVVSPAPADPGPEAQALPPTPATAAPVPTPLPRPAPTAIVHPPAPSRLRGRSVQVGAFRDPARAAALREELAKRFEWVMVTRVEREGVVWHRVRVEGLETSAAVDTALAALRRLGHQPIVVRD